MNVSTIRPPAIIGGRAAALCGLLALWIVCLMAPPALAGTLKVTGQLGFIGEWSLAADLTESEQGGAREFSGPYVLKHVGLCTHDGPEEKTGQMRLKLSASSARVKATLVVDKTECAYSAKKSDGYDGVLSCPGQPPLPLTLQMKQQVADAAGID